MKYVVLGASAAGVNAAATLRKLDKEAEIILISEDEQIYSRCIMHHYMEGIRSMERLSFVEPDFAEKNQITWIKGVKALSLDAKHYKVTLSDSQEITFDKLLIATGSHSFIPPIEGIYKAVNAYGFHDMKDCKTIMKKAADAEHIVILGAGLVGVDAASGLLEYGKEITLVDAKEHMLAIQLDEKSARAYEDEFEKHGVVQHYNVGIEKVITNDKDEITAIVLTNGLELLCDLLVVAAGVRANIGFTKGSGLRTDNFGLMIDDTGKTNIDYIYGAGDVTGRNPIWPTAVKEGIVAASNMAGEKRHMTDFFASKSTMNFFSIPSMSLGLNNPPDDTYQVESMFDEKGNYKKIIYKDGKIYGAILQGDLSYAGVLTQLIRSKIDISKVKKPLFQIDYSDFFNMNDNFEFYYENGQEETIE